MPNIDLLEAAISRETNVTGVVPLDFPPNV